MARDVKVAILGDAKDFSRAIRQAEGDMSHLGGSLSHLGGGFSALATAAAVGGGAILGLGVAAAKSFASFEQQLNTLGAVTGATKAQLKAASDLSVQLGNDLTLPATSAKDAADAMTELAKGGFTVEQAMTAAKGVLQLSAAAQIDNATAAVITANAINAFKLQASDATRVADLLAAASNASSAEITDIADAMQQAGAVFAANRVPIEDLTAAIGEMANAGIKGSDAGTSLKQFLSAALAPTKKAAGVMADLGIKLYDAKGNFIGMRDTIAQFQKVLPGLTQQQRTQALTTIFGSDAIRAANVILGDGVEQWDAMKTAVTKSGAAGDLANAKMKGLAGAVEALKSVGETMLLKVGMVIGPTLTTWAKALAQVLPGAFDTATAGISRFADAFKAGGVAGVFDTALAEWRAAWPAIQAWLGEFLTNVVKWVQTNAPIIAAEIGEWGKAFWKWVEPQIPPLLREMLTLLGKFTDWLITVAVPKIGETLQTWAAAFIAWVIPAMEDMIKAFWDWWTHGGQDKVNDFGERMGKALGASVVKGFRNAMSALPLKIVAGLGLGTHDYAAENALFDVTDYEKALQAGASPADFADYERSLSGRASGGPVWPNSTYLVGERGPELLRMGASSGYVVPNGASGGGGIVVNVDARGSVGLDEGALKRVITDAIAQQQRRNGRAA